MNSSAGSDAPAYCATSHIESIFFSGRMFSSSIPSSARALNVSGYVGAPPRIPILAERYLQNASATCRDASLDAPLIFLSFFARVFFSLREELAERRRLAARRLSRTQDAVAVQRSPGRMTNQMSPLRPPPSCSGDHSFLPAFPSSASRKSPDDSESLASRPFSWVGMTMAVGMSVPLRVTVLVSLTVMGRGFVVANP